MPFLHHISKEEVNKLPLVEFSGLIVVVDSPELVDSALDYLLAQPIVGVDTESRPSFMRGTHHPTALVQVATSERCYLFRLSKIGFPDRLVELFSSQHICKVGLAFMDDINGLRYLHDFEPANCIDLQKIVGQYGILDLGLQKVFAIVFHQKISKAQQLTNWELDELTPEQQIYAATDAWATLSIFLELQNHRKLPKRIVEGLKRHEVEQQILRQMAANRTNDITKAIEVLEQGGVIVYPTDTVWGLGCDATNPEAVRKLYSLKGREHGKAMLVLVDCAERITNYVEHVPDAAAKLIDVNMPEEGFKPKPLTIIYPQAKNLAPELLADDGSIGIRITYEQYSQQLCATFGKPIVSTSANMAGKNTPRYFQEIHQSVLEQADYVCHMRRNEMAEAVPSSIVKVSMNNQIKVIRP